jgi:hypothetical protein
MQRFSLRAAYTDLKILSYVNSFATALMSPSAGGLAAGGWLVLPSGPPPHELSQMERLSEKGHVGRTVNRRASFHSAK